MNNINKEELETNKFGLVHGLVLGFLIGILPFVGIKLKSVFYHDPKPEISIEEAYERIDRENYLQAGTTERMVIVLRNNIEIVTEQTFAENTAQVIGGV